MRILEDPRMIQENNEVNNSLNTGESDFLKKFWKNDE